MEGREYENEVENKVGVKKGKERLCNSSSYPTCPSRCWCAVGSAYSGDFLAHTPRGA